MYYAELNKSERVRQIQSDSTYMWNPKNETNATETDSQAQRTNWCLPDGRVVGGLGEKAEGIERCTSVVTNQPRGCEAQHSQ